MIFVSGAAAATWQTTLVYGALFGLFCYATFELTSLSLLKHWTWTVVVVDVSLGHVRDRAVVDARADDRQLARAENLSRKTQFFSWPGLSRPPNVFSTASTSECDARHKRRA